MEWKLGQSKRDQDPPRCRSINSTSFIKTPNILTFPFLSNTAQLIAAILVTRLAGSSSCSRLRSVKLLRIDTPAKSPSLTTSGLTPSYVSDSRDDTRETHDRIRRQISGRAWCNPAGCTPVSLTSCSTLIDLSAAGRSCKSRTKSNDSHLEHRADRLVARKIVRLANLPSDLRKRLMLPRSSTHPPPARIRIATATISPSRQA